MFDVWHFTQTLHANSQFVPSLIEKNITSVFAEAPGWSHIKFEKRTFFLLFMFLVIVIVPSSDTIKLFLYVLLSLLILFMPAKTTPPYSKTPQQQHLHQWLQTLNVYGSICFIELNVPNFLSIFRAFVRLWTSFRLPEVLFVSLVWHCVTLDSDTV